MLGLSETHPAGVVDTVRYDTLYSGVVPGEPIFDFGQRVVAGAGQFAYRLSGFSAFSQQEKTAIRKRLALHRVQRKSLTIIVQVWRMSDSVS